MFEEFHNGADLLDPDIEEDDIENLLIQQGEFCLRWCSTRPTWLLQSSFTSSRRLFEACRKAAVIVEAVR